VNFDDALSYVEFGNRISDRYQIFGAYGSVRPRRDDALQFFVRENRTADEPKAFDEHTGPARRRLLGLRGLDDRGKNRLFVRWRLEFWKFGALVSGSLDGLALRALHG